MNEQHPGNAVGQQLGNYRLQRLLGTGGFADVYLGEHLHLGTLAAIKVLHTRLSGEEAELFLQEARLIARLSHPHIIRVFDFAVADMTPFLIMDYAPGGTLRQRHPKKTQVPLPSIIEYVKQAADGLQYAHEQKLVHRDIKPENMLVDQHGRIVISDFGVASVAHSTESQTIVELAGTLPYIAPEQLQGFPRPASDQYALAVVVYEWISGERPFQGTFAEIVSQHLVKPPSPLYGRFPEVSPAVEGVIFKALSKDPRDRFETIREFARTLELTYRGEVAVSQLQQFRATNDAPIDFAAQSLPTMLFDATPDIPTTDLKTPSSISSSDSEPITAPYPVTFPSEHTTSARMAISQKFQRYLQPRWRLVALVVPLLLLLVSGGTLYAIQRNSSPSTHGGNNSTAETPATTAGSTPANANRPSPTTAPVTPTPSVDSQATVTAQQAVSATQTATAQARATSVAQQASATQTAVVQATTTAQASTPQGLYSAVTGQPPSFSDSLASQSSRTWDTNADCAFSAGNYVATTPAGHFITCFAQGTANICNLGYQVQMTTLSGDGGGLVFRHASNEYRLRVGPDGSYDLVNDTYSVTSGSSGAIHKGMNATNQLTIIAQDSKINLYINSQYVVGVTDKASSCGNIGLMSVGFGSTGKTAFSNAKVWVL